MTFITFAPLRGNQGGVPMRIIVAVLLLVPALFFFSLPGARAADPTAYHRQVYAEVNRNIDHYTADSAELTLDGAPFPVQVSTWSDNGVVRKMVLRYPDDHGLSTESLYFDHGELVFVFEIITSTPIDGSASSQREGRYYFANGRMIQWLDDKKQSVPPSSADFQNAADDITRITALVLEKMKDKSQAPRGDLRSTHGIFAGVEQGDYFHLLLTVDGEATSFFILQTESTLETLLADPDRYMGKEITVFWHRSTKDIPEAGGKMEIDTALSVKLP
jgi:hypothetical protein